ncbi:MAG: tyrosine-type recombinase/integrase, partial [Kiritimatiellia bacterium]|nr:tyrosine-type recombinase/integrase [Kiritimatiellia bacterium]
MKKSSRWWYARIMVNGKLLRFHLDIKIGGKRPPSLIKIANWHDAAFQRSYGQAKEKHDALLKRELSKKHVEETAQRIIEAKTGTRLDFVKVAAVPEAWATLPRKRPPSLQYTETAKNKLLCFADYMREHYPEAEDLSAVRSEHVRVFLDDEAKRGIAPRTWNITLKLLKTIFRRLEPNADAYRNFLKDVSEKAEDTIHREPFKDDEIEAILAAVQDDEIMRGPIVTAICTAMRRGDCALLKWASVDLDAGFIEVRTSKTGETAEIPILPALREELGRTPKTESEYVFPKAAELYQKNPYGLNRH